MADDKALPYTRNHIASMGRLTHWLEHIVPWASVQSSIDMLEIGIFEGRSAKWWLDNILTRDNDSYLGIDPWNHALMGGEFRSPARMAAVETLGKDTLSPYARKASYYKGTTVQAFAPNSPIRERLSKDAFDLIYVDGDHEPPGAMFDAVSTWPLCKPQGLVLFDDWNYGQRRKRHLHHYLQPFLELIRGQYVTVWEHFQLCIKRIA